MSWIQLQVVQGIRLTAEGLVFSSREAVYLLFSFRPTVIDSWIFTDGGCRNNEDEHVLPTDKAAWAYVILHDGHAMTATGGKVGATNNQMEMTAVLESLKALEDMGLSQKKLLLSLDSDY
ncbi:RNase H family protein, partial [Lactobacillus delbrueckii]|uniref:RNase H family protein n=1 Tax=Lactobacillus delbrueckii TaxID=1584 RepID=UPI0032DB393D